MPDLELYDADGNLIEDVEKKFVSKEMVDALIAEKLKEKEGEITAMREKLVGFESKDLNFKRLRDMNKEEREKLTAQELELRQRQEAVEEETKKVREAQQGFTSSMQEEYRNDAIFKEIGDNEEMKKKVLHHYDRIKDTVNTRSEISTKVRDAVKLARGDEETNPLFRDAPNLGSESPRGRGRNFAESESGKALAKSLGMQWANEDKK